MNTIEKNPTNNNNNNNINNLNNKINNLLTPEEQKELSDLQETLASLSKIIKNPMQFADNEMVGETLRKLIELYNKAKETQKNQQ